MNKVLSQHRLSAGVLLSLVQGDITEERVDAIVNAANSHLQHGGGVAGQIVRRGGPSVQSESDAVGYVPVGQAAATGAGDLPCRHIIHAVGPIWGQGDEDRKLRSAVLSSLALADELGLSTISLPAISSGIFGFPKDRCARVLLEAADSYVAEHPDTHLREVRFCLYDEPTTRAFRQAWVAQFGPDDEDTAPS